MKVTVTKEDGIWYTRLRYNNGRTKTFSVFDTKMEAFDEKRRLVQKFIGVEPPKLDFTRWVVKGGVESSKTYPCSLRLYLTKKSAEDDNREFEWKGKVVKVQVREL